VITIKTVLQFHVAQCSEEIRKLKAGAMKYEPERKLVFTSPQGETTETHPDCTGVLPPGWKVKAVEYQRVTASISPQHAHWPEYQALKARASQWLTALHLLKLGSGSAPLKKDVRKTIRSGGLMHHVGKRNASGFVFSARTLLEETIAALVNDPDSFAIIEEFVALRETEVRHATE